MADSDTSGKTCNATGFNYCFWGKAIVAIPAMTIISFYSASLFSSPSLQIAAGAAMPVLAAWLAMKIDANPKFSGLVVKKK
jgi:hypothetical protein